MIKLLKEKPWKYRNYLMGDIMNLKPMIRERRMEKHMTQVELAHKLHIDQTQISRYEKGKNYPGLEILMKLELELDCRLSDLYQTVE
jgi:transcriptional regulator with XRE-family HTH domain